MARTQQDTTAAAPTYPPLYKVVGADNGACHGGDFDYTPYLPTRQADGSWAPGPWIEIKGKVQCCSRGLHLTDVPAGFWLEDATCYRAEIRPNARTDGQLDGGESSKIAVSAARLLEPVSWESVQVFSEGEHVVRSGYCRLTDNASAALTGNASATLTGNASATLYGNASARLYGNASAALTDNASAALTGNASATLTDNASAALNGNASARLYGNASATLTDNASAALTGNASATLTGNASARLYGNASATLYDNASARLYDNASATLTDNATAISTRYHSSSAVVALTRMAAHVDRRGDKVVCRVAEAGGAS